MRYYNMDATLEKIYEQDCYLWLMKNAELVRHGRFSEADAGNIAEESECTGRSEKRELTSRPGSFADASAEMAV